jgi:hypothetical protein
VDEPIIFQRGKRKKQLIERKNVSVKNEEKRKIMLVIPPVAWVSTVSSCNLSTNVDFSSSTSTPSFILPYHKTITK